MRAARGSHALVGGSAGWRMGLGQRDLRFPPRPLRALTPMPSPPWPPAAHARSASA